MAASQQVPVWDTAVSAPETGKPMPAAAQQALRYTSTASLDARIMVCVAADAADHPKQDQQLLADPSPMHPSGHRLSAPHQTDAVGLGDEATNRPEKCQLHHMQQQEQQQAQGPKSADAPADSSTNCTLTATGHVAAAATTAGSEKQEGEHDGEHDSAPQQLLQESSAAAARSQPAPTPIETPSPHAAELDAATEEPQRSVDPAALQSITEQQQQQVHQPAGATSAYDVHEADMQQQSQQQQQGAKLTAGTASLLAALLRNQQALAALKNQYRKTQHVSIGSPTSQPGTTGEQQQHDQQQQQRAQQLQPHSSPRTSSSGCSSAALGPELQCGLRGLDRHSTAGGNPDKQQQQQPSIPAAVTAAAAAADAASLSGAPGNSSSSSGEPKPPTDTPAAAFAAAAAAASLLRPTGEDAAAAVSAAAALVAASTEQPMQPEPLKQLTTYLESMFMPTSKRRQQQQSPATPPVKHITPDGGALTNPGAAHLSDSKQPARDIRQRSASPLPSTKAPPPAAAGCRPQSPAAAGTPMSRSASPAGTARTSPVPRGVVQQLSAQHKRQLMLRMKAHMQKLGVDIKDHPMMAQLGKLEKEIDAPTAAGTAAASMPAAGPSSGSSRAADECTQGTTGAAGPAQEPGTAAAGVSPAGAAAAMGGRHAAAAGSPASSAAGTGMSAGLSTSGQHAGAHQPAGVAPISTTSAPAGLEQKQRQRQQSRKRALAALFQAEAIKVLEAAAAAAAAAPAPTLSGLLAPAASGPAGPGPVMLTQHSTRSAGPTGAPAAAGEGPGLPGQPSNAQAATVTRTAAGMAQGSAQTHSMRTSEPTAGDAAAASSQVVLQPGSMSPYIQQLHSWAEQQQQQEAGGSVQQPPVKRRRSSTPVDVPRHSMPRDSGQHQQGHMEGSTAVSQPPDSSVGQTDRPAVAAGGGGDGSSGCGGGSSGKPQIFAASSIAEAAKHFRWISKVNHPRWSKPETPLQRTFDRHVILEGMQQSKQQQPRGRGPQISSSQYRVGMDPAAAAATPVGVLPTWVPHAGAAGVDSSGGAGRLGARGLAADPASAYTAAVATAVQAIQCRIPQQQPGAGLQPVMPSGAMAALQQQQEVEEADPTTDPLWLLAAAADALPPHEDGPEHSTPATLQGSPSGGTAAAGRVPAGRHDFKQQAAGSPSTSTTSGQQQRMQSGTQQGPGRGAPAQAAVTLKSLEAELTRMVQAMGASVPQFQPAAVQAVPPASGIDTPAAAATGSQVLAGNVSNVAVAPALPSTMQQQGRQGSGVGVGLRSQPELSVRATGPEPIVGLFPQLNASSGGAGGGSGVDYSATLAAAAAAVFAELNSKRQRRA